MRKGLAGGETTTSKHPRLSSRAIESANRSQKQPVWLTLVDVVRRKSRPPSSSEMEIQGIKLPPAQFISFSYLP